MELIEALEQLSLHVRLNQKNNSSKVQSCNSTHAVSDRPCGGSHSTGSMQHNEASYNDECLQLTNRLDRIQLHEFDTSIETLFTQLLDLDDKSQSSVNSTQTTDTRAAYHFNGSIETSQEEDSDNSSQRSSYITNKHYVDRSNFNSNFNCHNNHGPQNEIHPFVGHLLKRDLGAITNTVRKLGKILSIGNEIETIYKGILNNEQDHNLEHLAEPHHYCRSLCSTFVELCSSEPCLCDLPTIIKYNDYCHLLLKQLDKLTNITQRHCDQTYSRTCDNNSVNCIPSTSQQQQQQQQTLPDNPLFDHQYNCFNQIDNNINYQQAMDDCGSLESLNQVLQQSESNEIDLMCLDDALDCALLECDQRQLDNIDSSWTNNKLYNSDG